MTTQSPYLHDAYAPACTPCRDLYGTPATTAETPAPAAGGTDSAAADEAEPQHQDA